MNENAQTLIANSLQWLKNDVFPLWSVQGVDAKNGGFVETLSKEGQALNVSRRALVQSRQIYSFVTAAKLEVFETSRALEIVRRSADFLDNYLLPSGACLHSVTPDGQPDNLDVDLYTQAFALFALALIYEVTNNQHIKNKALRLLDYLERERKAPGGGYTEIKSGKVFYQSNPHMHLFEASLHWMTVDPETETWKALSQQLFELCKNKFIDKQTGVLGEHFTEGWAPEKADGRFIFEPGHHYEWSWLMAVYQEISGEDCRDLRHSLYEIADKNGLNQNHLVIDEVWSDFTPKKKSSRFWPQCERIKAAVKLGLESPEEQQASFARSADEALSALNGYLDSPGPGMWQDTRLENSEFTAQDPKASSLYHIINAIYEYKNLRPQLR